MPGLVYDYECRCRSKLHLVIPPPLTDAPHFSATDGRDNLTHCPGCGTQLKLDEVLAGLLEGKWPDDIIRP